MSIPENSSWKTRLVERGFPDRSFDIEFWQEQGDEAIFSAAWELVELAEEISHGRKPTLQRTATTLKRISGLILDRRRLRGYEVWRTALHERPRRVGRQFTAKFSKGSRGAQAIWRAARSRWHHSADIHRETGCLSDWNRSRAH